MTNNRQRTNRDVYEFKALADYNAERARGIAHTAEYDEKMRAEQARFDRSMELHCIVCGHPTRLQIVRYDQRTSEGTPACNDCAPLVSLVQRYSS